MKRTLNTKTKILFSAIVGTLLFQSTTFAASIDNNDKQMEKKITNFEKQRLERNPNLKLLKEIKVEYVKTLDNKWKGYVFNISANYNNQKIDTLDYLFSDGSNIATELYKTNGLDYRQLIVKDLTTKDYKKEYLIAGNPNSKNKLAIFSDPLCPACIDFFPELLEYVNKNKNTLALYYFPIPLEMHPTAETLIKAAYFTKKNGVTNVDFNLYKKDFSKKFDSYRETNQQKVLDIFNKEFNTKITFKDLDTKEIKDYVNFSKKLSAEKYIQGTPLLFVNNVFDYSRSKHLQLK
jgi:protein-disulfide isomerase